MNIIGHQVRVSYFDQNGRFADVLPVTGIISSRHATSNVDDWYRIDLDRHIVYENQTHEYLLIRNRWSDGTYTDKGGTSVFVMLDSNRVLSDEVVFDVESFQQVAWGMAEITDQRVVNPGAP